MLKKAQTLESKGVLQSYLGRRSATYPGAMNEPRWITGLRAAILVVIAAVGVAFIVAILGSTASSAMKAVGVVGVAAVVSAGAIRIWLASRPYARGDWEYRRES